MSDAESNGTTKPKSEIIATRDPVKERDALTKLFVQYEKAEAEHAEAVKVAEAAARAKSAVVAKIAAFGKGPYVRKGRQLVIMKRGEEGKETYFFKGPSQVQGIEV